MILRRTLNLSTRHSFPRIGGGDPQLQRSYVASVLLFPAWAGVILHALSNQIPRSSFPRMGGGDPYTEDID